MIDDIDSVFRGLDWESLEDAHNAGDKALAALAEPTVLSEMFVRMLADGHLRGRAERFNLFSKIVLYEGAESGVRVRLHVFGDQMIEEAHNHRASFVARILAGSYRHFVFGQVDDLWRDGVPDSLPPRLIHDQLPGHTYTLHHSFVHATYARPQTVSLIIQGPRVRPTFEILDMKSGITRTRAGAEAAKGPQEDGEARMTDADLREIERSLRARGVLSAAPSVGPA
ncbi:hypothetical protein DMP17_44660 [Pseudonocardia sp. TMWB2A]|uniref:hypothetical protein n=1 Tax=Pseudonocardia sp. TMWB2A TaxID=687430 RepID=UPI00307CF9C1